MKPLLAALLTLTFVACGPPVPKTEDDERLSSILPPDAEPPPATPAATPEPKPGSWMWDKHRNPLDPQRGKATPAGSPLDQMPKSRR